MKNYKQLLQSSALKTTPARLAILSYLDETKRPLDVDTIHDHIVTEHDEADRATVYRILDTFVKKGLLTRLEFGEGKYRYELSGTDHHHLICDRCGGIEDISDCDIPSLEKDIRQKKGFVVKRHTLEFYGVCASCQI